MLLTALKRLRGTGSQVEPSSVVYKRVGTPENMSNQQMRTEADNQNVRLHTVDREVVRILGICAALLEDCTG